MNYLAGKNTQPKQNTELPRFPFRSNSFIRTTSLSRSSTKRHKSGFRGLSFSNTNDMQGVGCFFGSSFTHNIQSADRALLI
jgi:hypothetical protein